VTERVGAVGELDVDEHLVGRRSEQIARLEAAPAPEEIAVYQLGVEAGEAGPDGSNVLAIAMLLLLGVGR
jgi:hypothetical protein